MSIRNEKIRAALQDVAGEFFAREAGRQTLITVTNAHVSDDAKSGSIYFTAFPDSAEAQALSFANRNRREFADFFRKRVRGAFPPHIEFMIDRGEKNRQRLDELTSDHS